MCKVFAISSIIGWNANFFLKFFPITIKLSSIQLMHKTVKIRGSWKIVYQKNKIFFKIFVWQFVLNFLNKTIELRCLKILVTSLVFEIKMATLWHFCLLLVDQKNVWIVTSTIFCAGGDRSYGNLEFFHCLWASGTIYKQLFFVEDIYKFRKADLCFSSILFIVNVKFSDKLVHIWSKLLG